MTARNCLSAVCVVAALSGCGNDGAGGDADVVDAWDDEAADAEPDAVPDADAEGDAADDILEAGDGEADEEAADVDAVPDGDEADDGGIEEDGIADVEDVPEAEAEDAAEVETGPTDEDGDTYPEGEDCDDHDPLVFPGSLRPCSSPCGTGEERCLAGLWVACSAPIDCFCDPPGTTRILDCGRCGMASQRCGTDGVWEAPSACLYEGECTVGEIGSEACGLCGTRTRMCDASCAWMPWTACGGEGECAVGSPTETTTEGCAPGEYRHRSCDDHCRWFDLVPCTLECAPPRRSSGFEEELCIPSGPFLMGSDLSDFTSPEVTPVREVALSSYYIDRYKVTNARYRSCVAAGACTEPIVGIPDYDTYHRTPTSTYDRYPVSGVSWDQAMAFCTWDGGRRLPTEAQWEKAAKGPSPRQVPYPWGEDRDPCPYANFWTFCGSYGAVAADAYPLNTSYYGVNQMDANYDEWTFDFWDPAYYSYGPLVDPEGPATGAGHSVRGINFGWYIPPYPSLVWRQAAPGLTLIGFRCARPGR